jgi:hypothetical protein
MALTEPLEAEVVAAPHRTLLATPKRVFLALHCPGHAQDRVAGGLGQQHNPQPTTIRSSMAAKMAQPWRVAPTMLAEGVGQRRGMANRSEHLQEVAQRRRVLIRVGAVGVEEAAAVGAQLLDGDLRRRRALRQGLRLAGQGRPVTLGSKFCTTPG